MFKSGLKIVNLLSEDVVLEIVVFLAEAFSIGARIVQLRIIAVKVNIGNFAGLIHPLNPPPAGEILFIGEGKVMGEHAQLDVHNS